MWRITTVRGINDRRKIVRDAIFLKILSTVFGYRWLKEKMDNRATVFKLCRFSLRIHLMSLANIYIILKTAAKEPSPSKVGSWHFSHDAAKRIGQYLGGKEAHYSSGWAEPPVRGERSGGTVSSHPGQRSWSVLRRWLQRWIFERNLWRVTIQMKATQHYFPVVLFLLGYARSF